jgi:hypothetical protein
MVIVLDYWALEPALPDMANAAVRLVEPPRVSHGQRLEDPADALTSPRLKQQVKMVCHQTITVKLEWVALACLPQSVQEGGKVSNRSEHGLPVIAPVQSVVDQAIGD